MEAQSELVPAIVVVDSPWSVCTLNRAIFARYPGKRIIVVDFGQPTDPYFSDDDLIISASLKDTGELEAVICGRAYIRSRPVVLAATPAVVGSVATTM